MNTQTLSLEHLIRPNSVKKTNKPAVTFLLHGYGSNEEDLFSFAPELPEDQFIISVRAPYNLEPFGYAWYAINFDAQHGKWSDDEQAKTSIGKILDFINEACESYNLNHEEITLIGFSQGCILSYALALSYPNKIKRVIALSGYINEGILKENYEKNDFSQLSIYASHGLVDQVIPVEWAQKAPELLEKLGVDYKYSEYPVGHGVAPQNFYDFKAWLERKS
ncbi:alpha/beta hydrolase [Croceivirga radicis]|uniref:alpha/beta hydrolase n=1 Tax=Croceivirga radicis TaxID=1929488 RepID=UPI000255AE39|nr:alpha/beta fold hydrolase [Croceivirga radicis]